MKPITLVTTALACLLLASPALAGGDRPASYDPIDSQAIIDACKSDSSPGDGTKSLDARRKEAADIGVCYAAAILRLMEPMFDPGVFPREDAERLLIEMHRPAIDFYAHVLTRHRKCDCGDDAAVAVRLAAQKPLEGILLGIDDVRKEYSR